jgi:hypothetical protein
MRCCQGRPPCLMAWGRKQVLNGPSTTFIRPRYRLGEKYFSVLRGEAFDVCICNSIVT